MADDLRRIALDYHEADPPGKLQISATKPLANQHDLSIAYSPGVAHACEDIRLDPARAARLTARGNLVAVVTNGTAVLGLGNIGPLAAKPVMEGKAVLFKKFANIDVFDIELDANEPDRFVEAIVPLEPTFGGINLEDIKAPECFEIERRLRERMRIPVFHDDQHGTAIVVAAGIINALQVTGRRLEDVRLVGSGAGAAALSCLSLLVSLGLKRENIVIQDIAGIVYDGRAELMDPYKAQFATKRPVRTLEEAIEGADLFLGLSAAGVLKPAHVARMAAKPIVFALANPTPEIMPEEVRAVRPDAIIATGRSDYPNQVNNVLCFPFLFRGALDVGATTINEEMKKAAVVALAGIAQSEASDIVLSAYSAETFVFGSEYILPKPFDPRLITEIAPAVAKAAMASGVATRPIEDFAAYHEKLSSFVYRSGLIMRPVMFAARSAPKRLILTEGEHPYVLQATQQILAEGIAEPVLVGRREFVTRSLSHLGLRIRPGKDFRLVDPEADAIIPSLGEAYHQLAERRGVSPSQAQHVIRTNSTVIGSMLLHRGEADTMICGMVGRFQRHLRFIEQVIGRSKDVTQMATVSGVILPSGTLFLADCFVNYDPSAWQLADITCLAAEQVRRFGIAPKVALLSHSNFGSTDTASAQKMRHVLDLVRERAPDLEIEGEMQADAALSPFIREENFPNSKLSGAANLLILPNLDAGNIAFNLLKTVGGGIPLGPILLGAARSAHIVTPATTVRGLLNMAALAVVDAGRFAERASVA
jgi:malate dehydrogenase (oxaloacetate-decarboxylating)(NADP+)